MNFCYIIKEKINGGIKLKIEVEINQNIEDTMVLIKAKETSMEVQELIQRIQNINCDNKIVVSKNEKIYILNFEEIDSIYSNQGRVCINKNNEEYLTKSRLYELEEQLSNNFIRISNSEIINFDKVENLDLSITGTIQLKLKSGYTTYVSRRNIKKIKEYLKI